MIVAPFGQYQPDERHGEAYATEFTVEEGCGKPAYTTFAAIHMSDSGDSASIDRGYDTLFEAEVAAYLMARRLNAMFVPSDTGERP